jgi:pathogenesis-related protein 1
MKKTILPYRPIWLDLTPRLMNWFSPVMSSVGFLCVVLCLSVVSADAQKNTRRKHSPAKPVNVMCQAGNKLTTAEVDEILKQHNEIRAKLGSPELVWNCDLANKAQEWAARGVFEHRTTSLGENLFVYTNAAIPVGTAIGTWMSEQPSWNNATGTCAAGKECGHYTQIVWKKTLRIGCGVNRTLTGNWKVMLVCNYDPAGNVTGPAF